MSIGGLVCILRLFTTSRQWFRSEADYFYVVQSGSFQVSKADTAQSANQPLGRPEKEQFPTRMASAALGTMEAGNVLNPCLFLLKTLNRFLFFSFLFFLFLSRRRAAASGSWPCCTSRRAPPLSRPRRTPWSGSPRGSSSKSC